MNPTQHLCTRLATDISILDGRQTHKGERKSACAYCAAIRWRPCHRHRQLPMASADHTKRLRHAEHLLFLNASRLECHAGSSSWLANVKGYNPLPTQLSPHSLRDFECKHRVTGIQNQNNERMSLQHIQKFMEGSLRTTIMSCQSGPSPLFSN